MENMSTASAYINHASGSLIVHRNSESVVKLNSIHPCEYYSIGKIDFKRKPMSS
jgi:hypothetical protein